MQNIRHEITNDGLCVLTFDRANSAANIFDRATLEELGACLDDIAPQVRGLVLTSAKDAIFVAGADLHGIRKMSAAEVAAFIELGQTVFNKIAALRIPTVAAMHGAALGGGCEVGLACDWRIASPDACTKIGLPETKLGILPAWGGSTRLPRLIGVPKALDIILGGKTLAPKHALKLGMVDEVAPRAHLLRAARTWLARGKRPHSLAHSAPVNAVVDAVIGRHVRHDVEAKTHGHYPAVKKAMEVVMQGASDWDEAASLKYERDAVGQLLAEDSTRQLLNLFFLDERAKRRSVAGVEAKSPAIQSAAVIGAGVMGAGIAQWLSARGLRVILRDIDATRVAAGMATAAGVYASAVKRRTFTEREAVGELLAEDSTRQLLNLFFLDERAKKRSSAAAPAAVSPTGTPPVERAAVIGAGIMGAGIAQWLSARGLSVILRDIDAARVAAGMASAAGIYASAVKRRTFTEREARAGLARISPAPTEVPLMRTDIVIEAAVEKMEVKKAIFRRLDEQVRDDALLATNTSALSITELAAATKNPARVVGLHFFNPVHRMQLVEVVTGRDTAPETTQRALRFVQKIGKLPVLVKDSPGFLVNRILLPYLTEAARLFERGASAEAIDAAMIDFGMPMGPLRLIDEVGVDIAADVAATLSAAFPARMSVPEILAKLIAAGSLGRKNGKGFYLHSKDSEPKPNAETSALASASAAPPPREELARRMSLLMVNEAAMCLQEDIVETPGDVDFAMVMGTGFAPFRGGPLRYADALGAQAVVDELTRFADAGAPHYAPCARLAEMAKTGGRFYAE